MPKPNIILISIDTLRADHLSCYGYRRQTTPNLDSLAGGGALFRNAYSTAVWTPPAHASMLTGLYPCQHGVVDQNRLAEDIPTLAGALQQQGYHTAGFVNNSQVGDLVGLNRGHDDFFEIWQGAAETQLARRALHKVKHWSGYADHGAAETNRLVTDWLAHRRDRDRPFYVFIHYIDTHNPLKAPRPFRYHFLTEELQKQVDMEKIWQIAENPLICLTDEITLSEPEVGALKALYDEEILYVDAKIGELVSWLALNGLFHETLLIVTADHGEHWGEHGLYSHVASLYEPVVRVPLIVHFPPVLRHSQVVEPLVQLVDILPTIFAAAEIGELPPGCRGISLFDAAARDGHEVAIAEWEGRTPYFIRERCGAHGRGKIPAFIPEKQVMIRRGAHKLIQRESGAVELYDLATDPQETQNLAPAQPDLAKKLADEVTQTIETMQHTNPKQAYDLTEQVLKNLRDLGYM